MCRSVVVSISPPEHDLQQPKNKSSEADYTDYTSNLGILWPRPPRKAPNPRPRQTNERSMKPQQGLNRKIKKSEVNTAVLLLLIPKWQADSSSRERGPETPPWRSHSHRV